MDIESYILGRKSAGGGGSSLPATPSTDGTYTLTNTVASGSSTLAWGAGGATFSFTIAPDTFEADMTWQEMSTELAKGKVGISSFPYDYLEHGAVAVVIVTAAARLDNSIYVLKGLIGDWEGGIIVIGGTDTANGYPVFGD